MAISSELENLLSEWLPRQPWFPRQQGVLGRVLASSPDVTPMSSVEVFDLSLPSGGEVYGFESIIAVGSTAPGGVEEVHRLNIPLTYRTREEPSLRSHLIGRIDDLTLGNVWVYDAAADPAYVLTMAGAVSAGRSFPGDQVSVHRVSQDGSGLASLGSSSAVLDELDTAKVRAVDRGSVSLALIDRGLDRSVLTIFRILNAGTAAAVHMPVALTKAKSTAVPHVTGWMSGRWFDGYGLSTCELPILMLTGIEAEADTAWALAVRSALAVDSGTTASFADSASAIGTRIGELHADLAGEFGIVDSGPSAADWKRKWQERVDWALARSPLALEPLRSELRAHREWLKELDDLGGLQRIHGDLTLGNVVMAPAAGPQVRNFAEGADGKTADPKPPAFDLVALLRSLDYAAGFARLKRIGALDADEAPETTSLDDAQLRDITDSPEFQWSQRAQNSLLTGYSRAVEGSVTLEDPVLRAVLIDRLLVEAVTELRNRPAWMSVPLAALTLALRGRPQKPTQRGTAAHRSGPIEPTKVTKTVRRDPEDDAKNDAPAAAKTGGSTAPAAAKKARPGQAKKHDGGRAFGLDGTAAPVKKTAEPKNTAPKSAGADDTTSKQKDAAGETARSAKWSVPGDTVSAEDFAQRSEMAMTAPDDIAEEPDKSTSADKPGGAAESDSTADKAEKSEPAADAKAQKPAAPKGPSAPKPKKAEAKKEEKAQAEPAQQAEPTQTDKSQPAAPKPAKTEEDAAQVSGASSAAASSEKASSDTAPQEAPAEKAGDSAAAGRGLGGMVFGDYISEEDGDYADETVEEEEPPAPPKSARRD